ncbi:hypothetical protein L1987_53724 [Smallanthus sonchifolius]|uniref:Uncharacterized protein n=1 Tax=Smallanthus sonchifolius TaxID=185202 RepID=A0ACB9EX17_9ASTR|nr:hypothetical protein L1987_53724 [Smallanthus sonchifolius]
MIKNSLLVRFSKNDWIGFENAMEFEKSFEAAHHSKKEWNDSEIPKEAVKTRNEAVVELASEIDTRNENLDYLQYNFLLRDKKDAAACTGEC